MTLQPFADPFSYPLVTMDFEASALTLESYPIEVGIAIARNSTSEIEVWSSLIKPCGHWLLAGQWDPDSEKIHRISRRALGDGMSAADVVAILNCKVPSDLEVWCDGGYYDAHWLAELEGVSEQSVTFALADVGLAIRSNPDRYLRFVAIMRRSAAPHRAGPDAARLCSGLREMLEGSKLVGP